MIEQEQLCFLISPPRSGSTLLNDHLGLHSEVYAPPEPHIVYPLFQLGYYGDFQHPVLGNMASAGTRQFVACLKRGEEAYAEAVRAYVGTLYGASLADSGKRVFVDKTPPNVRYADVLTRVYPKAKYLVLARDPVPTCHSTVGVRNFVQRMKFGEPTPDVIDTAVDMVVSNYEKLSRLVTDARVSTFLVRYEDFIENPEKWLTDICTFLGVSFEPGMMDRERYVENYWQGMGDPVGASGKQPRARPLAGKNVRQTEYTQMDLIRATVIASTLGARLSDDVLAPLGYRIADIREEARRLLRLDGVRVVEG